MLNSSVFIFLMLHALYRLLCKNTKSFFGKNSLKFKYIKCKAKGWGEKTEVQTVILRCWTVLYINWLKSNDKNEKHAKKRKSPKKVNTKFFFYIRGFFIKWSCRGHWGHWGCWGCWGHWGHLGSWCQGNHLICKVEAVILTKKA
jgi:hypothetical protein